jgi:hypothetical protein
MIKINITDEAMIIIGLSLIIFLPQIYLFFIFFLFGIGNVLEKIGKYIMPVFLFLAVYIGLKCVFKDVLHIY